MSKCLAIKTEKGLEQTAQSNDVATAMKLALLQKQAEQGLGFNDRIIITESGEWEAPFTGPCKVTVIGGGGGSLIYNTIGGHIYAGSTGRVVTKYTSLQKGEKIDVTIGAAGLGFLSESGSDSAVRNGGTTVFKDISSLQGGYNAGDGGIFPPVANRQNSLTINSPFVSEMAYGNGGMVKRGYTNNATVLYSEVHDGVQGCVIIEFYNPEKASLPAISDTDLIPYVNLINRLEQLEQKLNESLVYNDEIMITESGTWTVPYDGDYEITIVGGGDGALARQMPDGYIFEIMSGSGGEIKTCLKRYQKGQNIPITIGAGGIAYRRFDNDANIDARTRGGITTFDDIVANPMGSCTSKAHPTLKYGSMYASVAGGLGLDNMARWAYSSNTPEADFHFSENDAIAYGGGGSIVVNYTNALNETQALTALLVGGAGNGKQGCVKIRFYNPEK